MFYREAGQFKTTYRADQAVFPIRQDQVFVAIWLAIGFFLVPLISSEYLLRAIFIPFLILALAALGLNLLVGYCGQLSLGTGGFMAVGAYAAYNLCVRIPELNPLVACSNSPSTPRSGNTCYASRFWCCLR
jgi:branched-chain amino acid transport system permease protein